MTDDQDESGEKDVEQEDALLEEQEQKGYGADEGEREEALDETTGPDES